MGDISRKITQKSLKAKRNVAIKTVKAQAKDKIQEIKLEYSVNAEKKKEKEEEKERKRELRTQKFNARLSYNARQPRPFTLGEDLVSSIMNGIGSGLSVASIVLLVVNSYFNAPSPRSLYIAPFALFGSCLFLWHLTATLRHAIYPLGARAVFSILNRCIAYALIASIYTPLLLTHLSFSSSAISSCVIIWVVCAFLIAFAAIFHARLLFFIILSYIILAAILVILVVSGSIVLEGVSKTLFLYASLSFALSLLFYLMRNFKWTRCIFHLFALTGNALVFFSFYYVFA